MLTSTITCIPTVTTKAVPAKNIPTPRRCKGLKGVGERNVFINTFTVVHYMAYTTHDDWWIMENDLAKDGN